jgi:hypothetical protein
MRVSEFMKMPDANTVFGSRENASFMSEMLQKFMVAQYQTNDEESKYVNAVANTIALVGHGARIGRGAPGCESSCRRPSCRRAPC